MQCDANGNCTCKDGFGGEQCDVCKEEGFTGSKCDECKPNIIGGKCDACQPNYFNYPSCQGKFSMYDQIFFFLKENIFFLFQNAIVTLLVQLLWNVILMAIAHVKMDFLANNVIQE